MLEGHLDILKELIAMEAAGRLDRACFDDIPIQVYHHPSCPGVSSTTIKTILKKSWNHVGFDVRDREAFRFGSAFHCLNNEPHLFRETYHVCPFDGRRGQDWDKERARAGGKIILMQKEFRCLEVMTKKLWLHPEASDLLTGAQFEMTYFSRDHETGVLKKCRVDAIKQMARKVVSDLKTTQDASPEQFRRDCFNFLYRISAAYYLEIVSEFYDELINDFYLIPCEKEEPHEVTDYRVDDESIAAAGDDIRNVLRKIAELKQNPKVWRGYPLGPKTITI